MYRKATRKVRVGNRFIGGDAPISVQSMTNAKTYDVDAVVAQILSLEDAGCDIVRMSIPDRESAMAIGAIKERTNIPLIADIHFDYRLAILAIENGIDKIRINPGNIGDEQKIRSVAEAAKSADIAIRVGANTGSLSNEVLRRFSGPTPSALVYSALENVSILEKYGFDNIVVAIKSSNVVDTIAAYREFSALSDYPLHLGVTEAGIKDFSLVKSSIAIGSLILDGIGDTLRVSITGDIIDEINAGKNILRACGVLDEGIDLITCPTCARVGGNLIEIAEELRRNLPSTKKKLTIAVMGCGVNGPGEAREADIGVALGPDNAILFKAGVVIRNIPHENIISEVVSEINEMIQE